MSIFVKDKGFYKNLFKLSAALALQSVIVLSVNLADNIMLGNYSQDALSGASVVNQIQFLLQMMITGVCEGAVVLSSRAWGRKDNAVIKRLAGSSMRFSMLVGLAMLIVMQAFPDAVLGLFSHDSGVLGEAKDYLLIVSFSYIPFAIVQPLLASLRSVQSVRIGYAVNITALIVNVALNYAFIFGRFGMPEMGIRGAAIATVISRFAELAAAVIYTVFIDKRLGLKFKHFFMPAGTDLLRAYAKVGLPVLLSNTLWGVAQAVHIAILGNLGSDTVSAGGIANTMFQVISTFVYGAAGATCVIMGKVLGEGGYEKAREYCRTLQVIYLISGAATSAVMLAVGLPMVGLYDITPEAARYARCFIGVLSVTVIGTSYQMSCFTGIMRAGGDTAFVLYNDMIFMWLIAVPGALLSAFVFSWPPVVTFAMLKSDQILKCFVALWRVNTNRWCRKLSAHG